MSKTYAQVVSQAIASFDSIYNALKGKLVTSSGDSVLTDAQLNNGTIPTSQYATFIENQLYRVGNATNDKTSISAITPVLVNGAIASYVGLNNSVSDGTYGTPTSTSIPVTFAIASPGYYDTTSNIVGNVAISNVVLDSNNIGSYEVVNNSVSSYLIQNANNIPMLTVSMPKGAVGVVYAASPSITETLTTAISLDSTASTVSGASLESIVGGYTISVKRDASYTGTGSIAQTVTTNAGFITSSDVVVPTPSFSISTNATQEVSTIYVPAGSVSGRLAGTAAVSVSGDAALNLTTTEPSGNGITYYSLTASATGLTILGSTTAGYIESTSDTTIGSVADKTETYYIMGGEVPDTNISLTQSELTYTDSSSMVSNEQTGHAITYGVTMNSKTTNITTGFITDTSYKVDVSGTKTIYIKEASIKEAAAITFGTITGSTSIIKNNNTGYYKITVPVSANSSLVAADTTAGYYDNANQITNVKDDKTLYFSVAQGSVSITPTLTAQVTERAGDGDAEAVVNNTPVQIFDSQAPATGDYYTITAGATKSATAGYIEGDSQVSIGTSPVYYLKKATFKYVEAMGDSEASFLEVTSGGYIPSGTIANIASISGQIDNASITIALSDSASGVLTQVEPGAGASYYTVTASKDTVNAGYISDNAGSVTGTGYILHGSESLSSTFNNSTVDTSTAVLGTNKYTFTATHSLTNTLTFNEGYIKTGDITLNGNLGDTSATITGTTSVEIAQGAYGITNKELTITTAQGDLEWGNSASDGYAITPVLSSGSITVNATTAGYISPDNEDFTDTLNNSDAYITKTIRYVKKGVGPVIKTGFSDVYNWTTAATTPTNISSITLTTNFADSSITGTTPYTVTLGGYAPAELKIDSGYYKPEDTTFSGGKVNLSKTLSIAHGKVNINIGSSSNSVSMSNGATSLDSYLLTSAPVSNFITIQSRVNVSTSTTVTEGYVKSADVTEAGISNQDTLVYIATPNLPTTTQTSAGTDINSGSVAANSTVYGGSAATNSIVIGSYDGDITASSSYATKNASSDTGLRDVMIIPTANKYALYDTKVVLSEHAMGSSVVTEMNRLEARLAGRLVTS